MNQLGIVLLAAGQGTRMNSNKQKILHEVGGKPMVLHVFEAAESVADRRPVLVVGPGAAGVKALLGSRAEYVVQAEQLGTGHATRMAQPLLQDQTERVIVTYGDMPLLRAETLRQLADSQRESGATIAMLTVQGDPASPFGRIIRDGSGRVRQIMEVAEARRRPNSETLLNIREQNVGVYCFDAAWLWQILSSLPLHEARSGPEYYLTDAVSIAVGQNLLVTAVTVADPDEGLGAGTRAEMVDVEKAFRRRANGRWLAQGVTLVNPDSIYLDQDVVIGRDTVIWPNTYVQGRSVIGEGCVLGPNSLIRDAVVEAGCVLEQCHVADGRVPQGTRLKPFTVWEKRDEH